MRLRIDRSFAAAAGCWLAAVPLAAAEGAGGGPFEGNVGNALWTLVVFALVVLVLGKFAWGPILSGLSEREKFIRSSLEEARNDRKQAEARLKEYTDQLNSARAEATAIVEEARRDADAVRRKIEEEARAEAQKIVERARREIGLAKEGAIKDLYDVSAKVTTEIVGRILKREIRAEDHERLIRDAVTGLLERGH
jgi:F-type H+-transporting ATPase subunit b